MSTRAQTQQRPHWVLMFIAVSLVAMNLRMTITGVGPLLDEIAADLAVSPATLGLLASVPMIAWAIVSPVAHNFAGRVGLNAAVTWSLVLLIIATVWRSLPGSPINLWLGTALIGAAIAIANVLLPAAIKRDFGKRVPLMMGLYSAMLGVAAALGAAMVAPISGVQVAGDSLGWRWALAATGIVAPFALAFWTFTTRSTSTTAKPRTALPGSDGGAPSEGAHPRQQANTPAGLHLSTLVWRDPVAWFIAIYMGMLSWNFYAFGTWFAPIEISRGADPIAAGLSVSFFHTSAVVGSIIAPFVARERMGQIVPVIAPVFMAIGAAGVVLSPDLLFVWLAFSGLGCGSGLFVVFNFIAARAATVNISSAVSGMVQSFGYFVTALGPVLFGFVHGLSGEWVAPLAVVMFAAVCQFLAGVALWRHRMALPNIAA